MEMASDRVDIVLRHLQGSQGFSRLNLHPTSSLGVCQTPNFRYTLDNPLLTYEQRQFYEENGFIVIPRLVDDVLLDECKQRFVDICEGRVSRAAMLFMKDVSLAKTGATGEFLYNKAQDIVWDDVFSKYITLPKLVDYVTCFTGPNVTAVHSMLINKPPDSGKMTSKHPIHQDLHYFPFRPADLIVAAWTAMEEVHEDNGCLFVLPGSHRGVLERHEYPDWEGGVNKVYHGVRGYDERPKTMLPMHKGDTVFFHPLLLHGSGANITRGFRKAISCHYASSDCHYIDVRGTTQENVAKEVEEIALRKGVKADYRVIWQARSRLVRGPELSLQLSSL